MMMTSIFERSKPANFIIVFGAVLALFLLYQGLVLDFSALNWQSVLSVVLLFVTLLVIDFIDKSNHLTENNSYAVFFFSTTFCFFPYWFDNVKVVGANLLISLAMFRLLSIWKNTNVKQKMFDASLLILIATLFYNWSILFLLMVWVAIIFYTPKATKNLFIPLLAMWVIALGIYVYFLFTKDIAFVYDWSDFHFLGNYNRYNSILVWIPMVVVTAFSVIASVSYLYDQKQRVGKHRVPELLISLFVISVFVGFISNEEKAIGSVFVLIPFSILTSLFVEKIKKKKIREIILWFFVLLPLGLLLLHFIPKS